MIDLQILCYALAAIATVVIVAPWIMFYVFKYNVGLAYKWWFIIGAIIWCASIACGELA